MPEAGLVPAGAYTVCYVQYAPKFLKLIKALTKIKIYINIQVYDFGGYMSKGISIKYNIDGFPFDVYITSKYDHERKEKYGVIYFYKDIEKHGYIKNKKVNIDYFNKIFDIFVNLNYTRIFKKSYHDECLGYPSHLEISINWGAQNLTINICNYDCNVEERGLTEIHKLVNGIFDICKFDKPGWDDLFR
jgi:hypothetical protein